MSDVVETAGWVRRFAALLVDWVVCWLVVVTFTGTDALDQGVTTGQVLVYVVYVVEAAAFGWVLGGSFGKIATGLRTVPADGRLRPLNPLKLLVRHLLVLLVIPPLVFKPDGRGLHDLAAGTATVTLPTYRAMLARARG